MEGVGTSSRRLESGPRFGETLRLGNHPTYPQRKPRYLESEARFREARRSGSRSAPSRDSPANLQRSKSSTRRRETPNEGSHPTSRRPVRRDHHSTAGPSSSNTWQRGGSSGRQDANCQRRRLGHPNTLFPDRDRCLITGISISENHEGQGVPRAFRG